jgi:regulator of chromosome condensation
LKVTRGSVYVFGRGDSGQLGLPEKKEVVDEPKIIKALQNVRQVSAGGAFSLAVTKDKANNLWAWGYGEMGQLANSSEDSDMPFQVLIKDRHVIQAAAGGQHTVLLISPKEA